MNRTKNERMKRKRVELLIAARDFSKAMEKRTEKELSDWLYDELKKTFENNY